MPQTRQRCFSAISFLNFFHNGVLIFNWEHGWPFPSSLFVRQSNLRSYLLLVDPVDPYLNNGRNTWAIFFQALEYWEMQERLDSNRQINLVFLSTRPGKKFESPMSKVKSVSPFLSKTPFSLHACSFFALSSWFSAASWSIQRVQRLGLAQLQGRRPVISYCAASGIWVFWSAVNFNCHGALPSLVPGGASHLVPGSSRRWNDPRAPTKVGCTNRVIGWRF